MNKPMMPDLFVVDAVYPGQPLGNGRIQSELKRLHEISLSQASIHKVLHKNEVKPIKKFRRKKDFFR